MRLLIVLLSLIGIALIACSTPVIFLLTSLSSLEYFLDYIYGACVCQTP